MAQYFHIHPDDPQGRLVGQAVAILRRGGVITCPTDSCYALACLATERAAVERIVRIRRLPPRHHLTLLCSDLGMVGQMTRIDNRAFRLIRTMTPGPYTFLLRAAQGVPRRLLDPRRRTVGVRIPDHAIVRALLNELGEPLLSTSLVFPGEAGPALDVDDIRVRLGNEVDLVIEGGAGGGGQTSVIDLSGENPVIVRRGLGSLELLDPGA